MYVKQATLCYSTKLGLDRRDRLTTRLSILNTADYYSNILSEVNAKANAGFDTSITDYWGRDLSYQLINATDGGPAYTFSSIALDHSFINGDMPFPVLVTDSRVPETTIMSLNSTVYEVNYSSLDHGIHNVCVRAA